MQIETELFWNVAQSVEQMTVNHRVVGSIPTIPANLLLQEYRMDKVIVDGKVAVLVSHGFGAGWSTWNDVEEMLYDPYIVLMLSDLRDGGSIDEDRLSNYCTAKYGENVCLLGFGGLTVHWIPEGTAFRINEYDGAESLELRDESHWFIA